MIILRIVPNFDLKSLEAFQGNLVRKIWGLGAFGLAVVLHPEHTLLTSIAASAVLYDVGVAPPTPPGPSGADGNNPQRGVATTSSMRGKNAMLLCRGGGATGTGSWEGEDVDRFGALRTI